MGFPSETTARIFVLAVLLRETEGGATNLPGCECTGENALLGKELNRRGEDYGKWCSGPPPPPRATTTRYMNTHSSAKTCGVGAPCACPAHAPRAARQRTHATCTCAPAMARSNHAMAPRLIKGLWLDCRHGRTACAIPPPRPVRCTRARVPVHPAASDTGQHTTSTRTSHGAAIRGAMCQTRRAHRSSR